MTSKHIFLSYRSTEADFALRLAADLKNAGVNLWMDRLDIKPGDDWISALQTAVNDCAAIISIVSPDYIASKYCRRELARADRMGRPIFPVLLRHVPPRDWPFEIERRQYIDFTNWQDEGVYHERLGQLVANLKRHASSQVSEIPDIETRYLTSLIADLEASKGVLEYVELAAITDADSDEESVRPKPGLWGTDVTFAVLNDGGTSDIASDEARTYRQRSPLGSIAQAVERYDRFVLIGVLGSGKTTAIQRLALQAARDRQANLKGPLPLLLHLPLWSAELSLEEFIKASWPFDSSPMQLLTKGEVFLYLDGLNEMGAVGGEKARELRDWLHSLYGPKYVVVTCRAADYTTELDLDLPIVIAEEMDETRIRHFVTNYLGDDAASYFLARILPEDVEDFDNVRHLFHLARNPFLLTVLILLYMNSPERDLPRNMGALIKQLINELWQREQSRDAAPVDFYAVEQAFAALAFAMIDTGMPNYVSRLYVLSYVQDEALLRAGISAAFMLAQGDHLHFYHQLILEYFAAVGLSSAGLPTMLTRPTFDRAGLRLATKWDQVIIALCGIVSNPDLTVSYVAEVDPFLALECIGSGINVSIDTRDQVIAYVLSFVEAEPTGRIAAALALNAIGHAAGLDILLDTMRSAEWEMRQSASHVLNEMRVPQLPGLLEALHDWEQDIREATATAVRQIGANAVPVLLSVLHDEHWSMRRGAAWALGEIGDQAAVPGLVDALRDEDNLVRREAAQSLGWIRDSAAVPYLLEAIHDKDWRVRKAAAETLGWIGSISIDGLMVALKDSSINVRRVAAEALGRIGHPESVPSLLDALWDDSVDVRGAAIAALGWIQSPEAVPRLKACLKDKVRLKWDKRRICDIAAEALAYIGTAEAQAILNEHGLIPADRTEDAETMWADEEVNSTLQKLLHTLKHEDGLKRWTAVKALAAYDDPEAVQALLRALGDEDILVCDGAAESLVKVGAPAVPGLLNALLDANPNVRGAAVETLGKIGDSVAVPALRNLLADTAKPWLSDDRICDLAVKALENIGSKEAVLTAEEWREEHAPDPDAQAESEVRFFRTSLPELLDALRDANLMIRQDAATALREQAKALHDADHGAVLKVLMDALEDQEWFVRWAVTEALAWLGDKEAVSAIAERLDDPNWMVQVAAVRALVELGDTGVADKLLRHLNDPHPMVREVCVEALGLWGAKAAIPGLISALSDPEGFVRRAAAEALSSMGDARAVPELTRLLRDEYSEVRWAAVEALGHIGDPAVVPELGAMLDDTYEPDWEEKRLCDVVADALESIGTQSAKQMVAQWRRKQTARKEIGG